MTYNKNWKGKILKRWITIILQDVLGHEVQESWPYLIIVIRLFSIFPFLHSRPQSPSFLGHVVLKRGATG